MKNQTTRALSQAVSLDGWIASFDEKGHATVHADIVFGQGYFGDDPTAKVRFKIALKRAEVIIHIPDSEPIKVIKSTVVRTKQSKTGTIQTNTSKKKSAKATIGAVLKSLTPSANANINASIEGSASQDIQTTEAFQEILCQHFTTPDNAHAWRIESGEGADVYLAGSPWDASDHHRMKIKKKSDGSSGGSISMKIEVRCLREDIEILDLEIKNSEKQRKFQLKANKAVNLAAAEQLIKEELQKAGFLEIPDLSERYSRLIVADKIILEED